MHTSETCDKAAALVARYNSDGVAPFPFERILLDERNLQITESDKLSEDVSGVIIHEDEKFIILVNSNSSDTRKYFTIARELGHYYLHRNFLEKEEIIIKSDEQEDDLMLSFEIDNSSPAREREANSFAACLIMPEDLVRKAWKALRNIEECAKVFEVSPTAMSIRLEKLGLIVS